VSPSFSLPSEADVDDLLQRWRADTPGCEQRAHLNNAGAALQTRAVLEAVRDHIDLEAELGGYEAADAVATGLDETYRALGRLVGATSRNMAVVPHATAGFIQALSSFDFAPGDVIVTSRCDYISNQIQYLSLSRRLGVHIVHAADLPEGGIDAASVRALARQPRCRLVAVTWVPTNSGLVQDVEAVGRECEAIGVPYLVDACQAVGQMSIDVARLHCDYLSATARKFLRGPRGIGLLYASDRALARGDHPLYVDMRGARWASPDQYVLADSAHRYENWEFPFALVLGLGAAARYALEVGLEVARTRAWFLAASLREKLADIPGVRVLDRGRERSAIVTAEVPGWHAQELMEELRRRGINSSSTLREYGQYDFIEKRVESAIRLAPHYYNTEDEVARAVEAIAELATVPVGRHS